MLTRGKHSFPSGNDIELAGDTEAISLLPEWKLVAAFSTYPSNSAAAAGNLKNKYYEFERVSSVIEQHFDLKSVSRKERESS